MLFALAAQRNEKYKLVYLCCYYIYIFKSVDIWTFREHLDNLLANHYSACPSYCRSRSIKPETWSRILASVR